MIQVARANCHVASSASRLQHILETILQPLSSGDLLPLPPPPGSTLPKHRFGVLFVDDVHLCQSKESDNVWALLRQLIVDQYLLPLTPAAGQRKFPWAPVRHMAFVVAATSRQVPKHSPAEGSGAEGGAAEPHQLRGAMPQAWQESRIGLAIKERSLTSFIHLNMLPPTRVETFGILSRGLGEHFNSASCSSEIRKLTPALCNATLTVIEGLEPLLRPSRMSAMYAQLDLRKVILIGRRLCVARGDALRKRREAILLWLHESRNVVCSSMMVPADEQLCLRHIAATGSKIFIPHQDSKNRRALLALEAEFLRALENLEYAPVPVYLEKMIKQDEAILNAAGRFEFSATQGEGGVSGGGAGGGGNVGRKEEGGAAGWLAGGLQTLAEPENEEEASVSDSGTNEDRELTPPSGRAPAAPDTLQMSYVAVKTADGIWRAEPLQVKCAYPSRAPPGKMRIPL
jgi:hypothetical protein